MDVSSNIAYSSLDADDVVNLASTDIPAPKKSRNRKGKGSRARRQASKNAGTLTSSDEIVGENQNVDHLNGDLSVGDVGKKGKSDVPGGIFIDGVRQAPTSGVNLAGLSISDPSPTVMKTEKSSRNKTQRNKLPIPASRSGCDLLQAQGLLSSQKLKNDKLPAKMKKPKPVKLKLEFEPYADAEKINEGLSCGIYEEGTIIVSPKSPEQAYIRIPGMENEDINVNGIASRNRAFNGDIVVVEIFPRSQWKVRPERIEDVQAALGITELHSYTSVKDIQNLIQKNNHLGNHSVGAVSISQTPPAHSKSSKRISGSQNQGEIWMDIVKKNIGIYAAPDEWFQKTGKVISVIEDKGSRQFIGTLSKVKGKGNDPNGVAFTLRPNNPRMPSSVSIRLSDVSEDILPELSSDANLKKNVYLVEMTEWLDHQPTPFGRIIKCVGLAGDLDSFTAAILVENGVEDNQFPLAELDKHIMLFSKITAEKEEGRQDFRNDCVFTIDPPDAKDLDDAVSCVDLGNGIFRVGVHIADVSFFVMEGSLLDSFARQRGTSVYLVNKVISMLPAKLIEACCSLDPGKDRRTVSVMFTITEHGEVLDYYITRGLIRSRAKLSYRIAQNIIEGSASTYDLQFLFGINAAEVEAIKQTVTSLNYITQSLRYARFQKGGLRIDQPEFRYELDGKGLPIAMIVREHWASCQLIEELALLTNMISASFIYQSFPEIALLRRHPPPQPGPLLNMQKLCQLEDMYMNIECAKHIQTSMSVIGASRPDLLPVISYLCAKPMKLAEYICTGMEMDTWHYALDVELYTHMTSPIRRYPDIIVHRLLLAALGYTGPPSISTAVEMKEIAGQCNDRKIAAGRCQEASLNLYMGLYIQNFGPLIEEGIVVAVYGANLSLDILAPRLAVVQRVFCEKVPGVKSVSHHVSGLRHILELVWGNGDVQQKLGVWSNVIVFLKTGSDVRNIQMSIQFPDPQAVF